MNHELVILGAWLVAASLMFFAGVMAIVAIGVAWLFHEERTCRRQAAGSTPEAWPHGRNIERRVEGPALRTIHPEEVES